MKKTKKESYYPSACLEQERIFKNQFLLIYLFFCLDTLNNFYLFRLCGSSLLCVGFLQLLRAGVALQVWCLAHPCSAFSRVRSQALGCAGSVVMATVSASLWPVESSWTRARTMSPALADRSGSTGPLGESPVSSLKSFSFSLCGIFGEMRD